VEAATTFSVGEKMDEKQSSLKVFEKENKLRKLRKVTQKPCERTEFCLKKPCYHQHAICMWCLF